MENRFVRQGTGTVFFFITNDINFFGDLTNYGYICSPKVLRTW